MIAIIVAASAAAISPASDSEQAILPPGVAEVIDVALASGDAATKEAVLRTVRQAHPQAAEAIDRRVAAWAASHGQAPALAVAPPPVSGASSPPHAESANLHETTPLKWSGEGEAGAFANSGNTPGIGIVGGFKLLVEGSNWRIGTTARADYQETANVVTREQYRLTAEPNYKFGPRGYLYGLGQYEKDRFQGFDVRYSLSGGLGYSVLASDNAKFNVKAGPAWRVTRSVTGERESILAGLASVDMKFSITPRLQYSQDASAYVDGFGSTLYTLAALDSQLIGKLKARLSYMVQHETAPEAGRQPTDTTSRLTLVYGF